MKYDILEKADELVNSGKALSVNTIETFVHETLAFFEQLRTVLTSGTPEEKKEAMAISEKLQQKLQEYAQKAYDHLSVNPPDLQNLIKPENFAPEEWQKFQNAQKEIDEYQREVIDKIKPKRTVPPGSKPPKKDIRKEKI